MYTPEDKQTYFYYIQALERILKINEQLPDKEKIRIVSVSWNLLAQDELTEQMKDVLKKCQKAGIFVNHTGISRMGLKEHGLDRDISKSADDVSGYKRSYFFQDKYQKDALCFPMHHRTVASHIRPDEYIHEAAGGWSWIKPYESALYLLAKQVSPELTFEDFWKRGLGTGVYDKKLGATIVQPIQLIEGLQKEPLNQKQSVSKKRLDVACLRQNKSAQR